MHKLNRVWEWGVHVGWISVALAGACACTRSAPPPTPTTTADQIRLPAGAKDISLTEDEPGTGGADYREKAIPLRDRLTRVTTYSDRAELTREGEAKLAAGQHWLEFTELPRGFLPGSVRVELGHAFSGRILQLVGEEIYAKGLLSRDARAKLEKLRTHYGELLSLQQRQQATQAQLDFVRGLRMDAPVQKPSPNSAYKGFAANSDTLRSAMGEIQVRAGGLLKKVEDLKARSAELRLEIAKLEGDLRLAENGGPGSDQDWKTRFYVLVDSKVSQVGRLELRYQVPDALWKPVYDLRAELDRNQSTAEIQLLTAGMIEQKTGEDWKAVHLTLSTLDPVPLYLPKRERWVLKERREEAPADHPVSATRRVRGQLAKKRDAFDEGAGADYDGGARPREVAAKQKEVASAQNMAMPASAPPAMRRQKTAADERVASPAEAEALGSLEANIASEEASSPARTDKSTSTSLFPLLPLEQLYPDLGRLVSGSSTRMTPSRPLEDAAWTPAMSQGFTNSYSDPRLPAVQAGGRRMEFSSPFAVDVQNGAPPLKIAVHRQKLRAKLSYYAIPKMDPRVFLRAETVNSTERPLLGGSAQIYMDGDLVSKTDLSTVNEGGRFQVDLGIDRNIETKRVVDRKAKTSGFLGIGKKHATEVEVRLEIANNHPFPVRIDLRDNYPLASSDQIEATLKSVSPDVPEEDKRHGLLRWNLEVPANSRQAVKFTYLVVHPENTLVSEFN